MKIRAADGFEISFNLKGSGGKGAVLVVPAMGVPQRYYQPFAEWLAEEGYVAATFDFRGMGESRGDGFRHSLRGFKADILDWARLDTVAALDALAASAPGVPLYWIGHSLGGQILPFVPNHTKISKVVTVAAGSGYWRYNTPGLRWRAWFLWHCLTPLSLALTGYFAGAKLGVVGDLPAGVIRQWRRWCLQPEYAVGDGEAVRALYAAVRIPIASLSFPDDEFMSARSIESLHAFYTNSKKELKRIAPQDIGVRRIGHFGFFRSEFRDTLWRRHLLPELA